MPFSLVLFFPPQASVTLKWPVPVKENEILITPELQDTYRVMGSKKKEKGSRSMCAVSMVGEQPDGPREAHKVVSNRICQYIGVYDFKII